MSVRDLDEFEVPGRRKRRAIAVVVVSVLVMAAGAIAWLHPALPAPLRSAGRGPVATPRTALTPSAGRSAAGAQPGQVQFISRTTGWVFMDRTGGSPSGLYSTADAGRSWTLIYEGPPGQFHFFDSDHGMVTAGPAFLLTSDGGKTWRSPTVPEPSLGSTQFTFGSLAEGLALNPQSGDRLRLFRSSDGGFTWNLVLGGSPYDFGLPSGVLLHLSLGFSPPALAWLSAFNQDGVQVISVSRDGGRRWQAAPLPPPGPGIASPGAVLTSAGSQLAALAYWAARPSASGGAPASDGRVPVYAYTLGSAGSWTASHLLDTNPGFATLALDDSGTIWAAVGGSLCQLTAGLTSCQNLAPPEPQALQFLQVVDTDLFAIDLGGNRVVTSFDGGRHWKTVPTAGI